MSIMIPAKTDRPANEGAEHVRDWRGLEAYFEQDDQRGQHDAERDIRHRPADRHRLQLISRVADCGHEQRTRKDEPSHHAPRVMNGGTLEPPAEKIK